MGRNIIFSTVNILAIAVFFGLIWGIEGYAYAVAIQLLLVGLLCWNPVGDWIITKVVLQGKHIPAGAGMQVEIERYLRYLVSANILEDKRPWHLLWTKGEKSYFLPVSSRFFVVTISLEDTIIKDGAKYLRATISNANYDQKLMHSRRILLLTALGYMIARWLLELWAIFFAAAVKILITLCVLLASGALFGSGADVAGWGSIGHAVGTIAVKINDAANYIQDKLVEWLIKTAVLTTISASLDDVSV